MRYPDPEAKPVLIAIHAFLHGRNRVMVFGLDFARRDEVIDKLVNGFPAMLAFMPGIICSGPRISPKSIASGLNRRGIWPELGWHIKTNWGVSCLPFFKRFYDSPEEFSGSTL